ncbi:MAG: acyl carrier protein [Bacteroidota bacterium]
MEKPSKDEFISFMQACIGTELKKDIDEIKINTSFHNLGLDSITSVLVMEKIENHFNVELNPIYFWDYPTIAEFVDFIFQEIMDHEKA